MALAFLPLILLIEIIFLLALPDRFVITLLPFFGMVLLAFLILSGIIGGSSSGSSPNPVGGDGTPTYSDGTPIDPFANSGAKTYHSLKNGNEYIRQVAEYQTYVVLRDEHGNTFNATKGHDGMVYDSNGNYYRSNDI